MARRARKPCGWPGCGELVEADQRRCSRHCGRADGRPGSTARGYNYRWQRARQAWLREHPLCEDCAEAGQTEPATEVHHLRPHRGDRGLFWHQTNWRALCKACHSRQTAQEGQTTEQPHRGGGVRLSPDLRG